MIVRPLPLQMALTFIMFATYIRPVNALMVDGMVPFRLLLNNCIHLADMDIPRTEHHLVLGTHISTERLCQPS